MNLSHFDITEPKLNIFGDYTGYYENEDLSITFRFPDEPKNISTWDLVSFTVGPSLMNPEHPYESGKAASAASTKIIFPDGKPIVHHDAGCFSVFELGDITKFALQEIKRMCPNLD